MALVDLDLSLGDADVFLDTIPDYTIVDVVQNIARLDFQLLKRSMTKHSSGLYLLPRPVQLQDISLITPDDLQRVFGLLKATFSHVIIDLSKAYNRIDMTALQAANQVLLVTQLDLPCLRNVVRLMMSFDAVDGLKDKVQIVVNRIGLDNGHISLKKAKETIGRDIFWRLPNDYRVMVEMRNNGVPLVEQAPRAAITQAIIALAEELSGVERGEEEARAPTARAAGWPSGARTRPRRDGGNRRAPSAPASRCIRSPRLPGPPVTRLVRAAGAVARVCTGRSGPSPWAVRARSAGTTRSGRHFFCELCFH